MMPQGRAVDSVYKVARGFPHQYCSGHKHKEMTLKVCLAFALVALPLAEGLLQRYTVHQSAPRPTYGAPQAPAKYDFDWVVNDAASGNDFGQQESRDGDNTKGSYSVLLPDGRLQRVTYNVEGDSGFVAENTYEGEARPYSPPQPSYAPPAPTYAGN